MEIVLIGAGNLATHLGKALYRAGHTVLQVYSRTEKSAATLASLLHCPHTCQIEQVVPHADLFIIAVKDDALPDLATRLLQGRENEFFVHTAGSVPLDALPSARRGVAYPMQTFSKEKEVDFSIIPCFVEASTPNDERLLTNMLHTVTDSVRTLDSEQRRYLHLAAVFCCNFANHCFALAERLLKDNTGLPFSVMQALVDETAAKLHTLAPTQAQTGPAVRWDTSVMHKHLDTLASDPALAQIYRLMSQSIHDTHTATP